MIHLGYYVSQVSAPVSETGLPQITASPGSVSGLLQLVFGVAGAIAILMVVFGGFKYVVSQGDPQSTAKAKDTILYALIGLALCITSYSIVTFVATRV